MSDTSEITPPPPPPEAALSPAGLTALRRRTMAVLVTGQILGGFGVATGVALASLLAADISGSDGLSGLAMTASVLGTAALSLPLAGIMSRHGRRAGLALGYLVAAAGGAVVVLASVLGLFWLLLAGMAVFGAGSAANLQARFAAADLAPAHARAGAIATIMWATTLGSVLGPNIAGPAGRAATGMYDGIPHTAGPFLWASVIFLLAGVVVHVALRPDPLLTARALAARDVAVSGEDPPVEDRSLRAGLATVTASSRARLAVLVVAVSHTVMVAIMVMTPLDLDHHGAGVEVIGLVISIHVAGMYAFSPLVGRLADRVGRLSTAGGGLALLITAAALAGTADGNHVQATIGLFLLGLGWSGGVVGGSALLTDTVPTAQRAAAQGLSDLAMNGSAAVGGAFAGVVVATAGYGWLTLLGAVLLLPVAAATLRVARRPSVPAPPG